LQIRASEGDSKDFDFEESFGGKGTKGFDWDILLGIMEISLS